MSGHGSPRPEDQAEHANRKVHTFDGSEDEAWRTANPDSGYRASQKQADVEEAEASGKPYW